MRKLKLFIENFLVYGLGGIISKVVPLIMVPIITRMMPDTSYFGLSDMSNTVIQFASALAIMGMYDAMYRMFFEKEDEEYQKTVCSTALLFTLFTSIVVFIIMIFAKDIIAQFFFEDKKYSYLVYITAIATLVGSSNSIISAPTRMQNKRKVFLITNTLSSVLSYAIAIPLLLKGYYIIALPLSAVIAAVTLELIFAILNRSWFNIRKFDRDLLKQMLVIAIPLLPNFLCYWVFNSCDRVMITNMLGLAAAGVYSVGAKLGQVSQLIYTAFVGGWQYFAFATMKDEDQVVTNSRICEYLAAVSFVASVFMSAWSKPIFELLFDGDYVQGWKIAPYLFMAPLLQMLFQVACNQFLVVKKTWPNLLILLLGVIVNIVLNLVLIPIVGVEGAAIATVIGYAISDVICILVLCKMKLFVMSGRFIVITVITLIYMVLWKTFYRECVLISTLLAAVVLTSVLALYVKDLLNLKRKS